MKKRAKSWAGMAADLADAKFERLKKSTFIVWVQYDGDTSLGGDWIPYGLMNEAQVVDDINTRRRSKDGRRFLVTEAPLTWTNTVELNIER